MQLAPSLKYSVYGLTGVLLASGVAWLVFRYAGLASPDSAEWRTMSMRVHGAAAMAMIAVAASAASLHAMSAWRERKNRASGVALGASLVVLTVTGYLLYYLGGEATRSLASVGHWALGLALPALFASHTLRGQHQ